MTNPNTASGMEKNLHILVADDHEANQKIVQLILQRAGYQVDVVETGQQAVEACQQNHYDLILMDIQMPLMGGLEATEEIRKSENEKEIPIIAMTGSAGLGKFNEKRYPGMNDCIGKPLQRDEMLSVVLKWIRPESNTPTNEKQAVKTGAPGKKSEENQFPIDLDRAIQEFMGQKEILIDVLQKFVARAGSQVDTIHQAVKGVDYGTIGTEAHAIKGAAANLTADKLAGVASDLEQAAEKQQPDLAGELAHKLEQEFNCLERYIRQTLS